ncbi:protein RhiA [Photorhabdus noenieputensis]|uniref:protein RhiA n=1 Tax=Photorhabdus noenieputensis TaxID=1208607 RepID=UPI001BD653C4|nr:protein RhiA [Photorhabdus noenieputensis]MBS9437126.1 protein RhiA [Photorhabdus noenieputensis]MCK3670451.1 protein RhiA [Photorhabdus noenieputensis]
MSQLDISSASGTPYTVRFENKSPSAWTVYLYQKMPEQPSDVFSLAWQASPFKIASGAYFTFKWSIEYSFIWGITGTLTDGVVFEAGQIVDANLIDRNIITFNTNDNTPAFGAATDGGESGILTIKENKNIPNNLYTTGIGMSKQGTFVQQVLANTIQFYTPEPKYHIAVGVGVKMGQVLAHTVSQSSELLFKPNVYNLTATLTDSQTWSIS